MSGGGACRPLALLFCAGASLPVLLLYSLEHARGPMRLRNIVEPRSRRKISELSEYLAPTPACADPLPVPLLAGNLTARRKEILARYRKDANAKVTQAMCGNPGKAFKFVRFKNGRAFFFPGEPAHSRKYGCAWQPRPYVPVEYRASFWRGPSEANRSQPCSRKTKDSLLVFRTWFQGKRFQYGHVVIDLLPPLFWLLEQHPAARPVLELGRDDVIKEFLAWFAPGLHKRATYLRAGEILCSRDMIVAVQTVQPGTLARLDFFGPLRGHILRKFPPVPMDKVVYYSRTVKETLHKRFIIEEHRAELLQQVQEALSRWQHYDEIVFFEGNTSGVETFARQLALFRAARLTLGPHGGGLANIVWMQEGAAVIEFTCSAFSTGIDQCVKRVDRAFFNRGLARWLRYFHVFYTEESSTLDMRVDMGGLRQALDRALAA